MADSPSSLYSMDGLTDLVHDLPESNGEPQDPSSDEGFFDIDVLISKLDAYKKSVEETEAQLRPKRSFTPKQVSDTTAAARFKLRLEGRSIAILPEFSPRIDSLQSPTSHLGPSSTSSSSDGSMFNVATPQDRQDDFPILEKHRGDVGQNVRDTWKSSHSVGVAEAEKSLRDERTESKISPRSARMTLRPPGCSELPSLGSVKLYDGCSAVGSPVSLASPSFAPADWLDTSRAISPGIITSINSDFSETRRSIDDLSIHPPREDQIRREIERYTIKDWIQEDVKRLEAVVSAKEPVQFLSLDDSDDEDDYEHHILSSKFARRAYNITKDKQDTKSEYGKPTFREKVAGFKFLHKRSKTDKIIDLYMNMEPTAKQQASPKLTRTWTTKQASPSSERVTAQALL